MPAALPSAAAGPAAGTPNCTTRSVGFVPGGEPPGPRRAESCRSPVSARARSPRWERLDAPSRSATLAALEALKEHGVEQVPSVGAAIAELRRSAAPVSGGGVPLPPTAPGSGAAAAPAPACTFLPPPALAPSPPKRPPADGPPRPSPAQPPRTASCTSPGGVWDMHGGDSPPARDPAASAALLSEIREHLAAFDGELYAGVYRYLCDQPWFWRTMDAQGDTLVREIDDEIDTPHSPPTSAHPTPLRETDREPAPSPAKEGTGDGDPQEAPADYPALAQGVVQAVGVLESTLKRYAQSAQHNAGETALVITVVKEDTHGFQDLSTAFRQIIDRRGEDETLPRLALASFPTRTQTDSYRGRTVMKRVLAQCAVSLRREANFYQTERQFELYVNLLGECAARTDAPAGAAAAVYNNYTVITAQGQRSGAATKDGDPAKLADLTGGRNAVVRASSVQEAVHRFKVALVRAIEHTIHHVIHSDFMSEVGQRVWEETTVSTPKGHLGTRSQRCSMEIREARLKERNPSRRSVSAAHEDCGVVLTPGCSWTSPHPTVPEQATVNSLSLLPAPTSAEDGPELTRGFSCSVPVKGEGGWKHPSPAVESTHSNDDAQ